MACRPLVTAPRSQVAVPRTVVARDVAPRTPLGELGSLTKLNHGLLGRQVQGDATDPLDASLWTGVGLLAVGGSGVTEHLRARPPTDLGVYVYTFDPIAPRGEAMVTAALSGHEPEAGIDINVIFGLVLMADPGNHTPDESDFLFGRYRVQEDAALDADRLLMGEVADGVSLVGNQRLLSPVKRDVGQRAYMSFWANPDGDYAMFDGFAAQGDNSIFERLGAHARTTGRLGLCCVATDQLITKPEVRVSVGIWFEAGRYVHVLDAPAGHTAEVRDAAGEVLVGPELESGGEIELDMMVRGDGVWQVDPQFSLPTNPTPADGVELVVRDAGGDPVAALTPEPPVAGVWGGESYSFSECS